jgi:hypothetical protein
MCRSSSDCSHSGDFKNRHLLFGIKKWKHIHLIGVVKNKLAASASLSKIEVKSKLVALPRLDQLR